jgi:hypothetical protein
MILGIIGFVFGILNCITFGGVIPGVFYDSGCSVIITSVYGSVYDILFNITIITSLGGLVFGLMAKSKPKMAGILLIIVAVLSLLITFFSFSIWALFMFICFLIGGIVALTR